LADKRLIRIEEEQTGEIEDGQMIMMLLRHEAGHCINYAYRLYETPEWRERFGPFNRPYRDRYKPVPFDRRFVRHMEGWYAQKHPDEDFAESFAVWLTPDSDWKRRYARWPALRKLQYVDRVARELADTPPRKALEVAERELPVEEMASTVEQFYREHDRDDTALLDDVPDAELEDIFVRKGEELRPASAFLLEYRKAMIDKITYWTGVRRAVIRKLVEAIARRARELELSVERKREAQTLVEVVAFATTLAMNYLTRGGFTER
ncbi:MAG TPA: hypothetical protein VE755_10570, partial [Myxococcales bacterium]|nr:hypothetical protein [Myxococcales bacterium]